MNCIACLAGHLGTANTAQHVCICALRAPTVTAPQVPTASNFCLASPGHAGSITVLTDVCSGWCWCQPGWCAMQLPVRTSSIHLAPARCDVQIWRTKIHENTTRTRDYNEHELLSNELCRALEQSVSLHHGIQAGRKKIRVVSDQSDGPAEHGNVPAQRATLAISSRFGLRIAVVRN